jgi:nucleotide-binding universal stress UspA family protein
MPAPVLVASAGPAHGGPRTAALLADALGTPLVVATAYDADHAPVAPRLEGAIRASDAAAALAGAREVPTTTRVLPAGDPADELAALAGDLHAGAVVLGPDRGGTVTRRLLRVLACPVVVAPEDPLLEAEALAAIGVAFDGSPPSRLAVRAAAAVAAGAGAVLHVLSVDGEPDSAAVPDGVEVHRHHLAGRPVPALRRFAADLDLLCCGARGRGRLTEALLGSVSAELVRDPVCAVLVVPARVRRDLTTPLGLTRA